LFHFILFKRHHILNTHIIIIKVKFFFLHFLFLSLDHLTHLTFLCSVQDCIKLPLQGLAIPHSNLIRILEVTGDLLSSLWILLLHPYDEKTELHDIEALKPNQAREICEILLVFKQEIVNECLFNFVSKEGSDYLHEVFIIPEKDEKI